MGHDKLRKFKENESFSCLLQPSSSELLDVRDGIFGVKPHPVKGRWNQEIFSKSAPIVVELGCGKGEYTVDLGQRNQDCNYIGVDIKGARLWKGAKFATQNHMTNVAFLRTRIEFIEAFFAPNEVSEIWLTFSDPQLRGENKRLTSPAFLERYRKFLKRGGIIHLKTDSQFLHHYSKDVAQANGLESLACTDDLYGTGKEVLYASRMASVCGEKAIDALFEVQTYYERMFLGMGLKITYLSFCLDHNGPFVSPDSFDADYWRSVEGPRRSFGHGGK